VQTHLSSGVVNDLLGGQVTLVAHKQLVDALTGVSVDLLQPLLDVVKGLLVGDVVDDDDAVSAAIVAGRDGPESLLSGRIPDLQLNGLSVELDGADLQEEQPHDHHYRCVI
jgi:hypothetical protein